MGAGGAFDGRLVTAESRGEEPGYPSNGSDANAGSVVNFSIRHVLQQQLDNLPTVDQCLEFGGSAQIHEEIAALGDGLKCRHCAKECIFGAFSLNLCFITIWFHEIEFGN